MSGFIEPFLYLLSIGFGLGGIVGRVVVAGGHSVPYATFVAPGLLATASMNGAASDATFSVYFRLKHSRLYEAVLATSMEPGDVALGEITWALLRGGCYAIAFTIVMAALGLTPSTWSVLTVPVALLIGFAFAGTGMAATTFMRSMQDFDYVIAVTTPMFLLSGSFYPLSVYPHAIAVIIECTPLYQGVALLRMLTLGNVNPVMFLHGVYLSLMGLAGLLVSERRIGKLLLS